MGNGNPATAFNLEEGHEPLDAHGLFRARMARRQRSKAYVVQCPGPDGKGLFILFNVSSCHVYPSGGTVTLNL